MDVKTKKQGSLGSDAYLREQLELAFKEIKSLKHTIDQLQKENESLKKSLFDLSAASQNSKEKFFNINVSSENEQVALLPKNRPEVEMPPNTAKEKNRDPRFFQFKGQLDGHVGAVYAAQFAPNGRMIASGSFDKTVRIWDPRTLKEIKRLEKHFLNVSDVCWSRDSLSVFSGSYDQTVNLWEIEGAKAILTQKLEGFVQCVSINPADEHLFYAGTTRNHLYQIDKRKPGEATTIANDSMVNSLIAFHDGIHVMTGDSNGNMKTWDIRNNTCIYSVLNEPSRKPISHIHASSRINDEEVESRYLSVNSYDNVIRVYDRGITPAKNRPELIHALKGQKNQNWPIKSCFYHGTEHVSPAMWRSSVDDESIRRSNDVKEKRDKDSLINTEQSLLLATGSADSYAYIFDVSGPEGSSELIQKLEGHKDRVYSVTFHPTEPILTTCSADGTLKVWSASRRTT